MCVVCIVCMYDIRSVVHVCVYVYGCVYAGADLARRQRGGGGGDTQGGCEWGLGG